MYSAMVLVALCNMIYLALHVTGSGSFPKPLSKEEEEECLERIQEGDEPGKKQADRAQSALGCPHHQEILRQLSGSGGPDFDWYNRTD